MPFLIFFQLAAGELAVAGATRHFLFPVDGLSAAALGGWAARGGGALRLLVYVKSGENWREATDPDDARWSGYRTADGGAFRFAQAGVSVLERQAAGGEERAAAAFRDAGLVRDIPTCIPARLAPDYRPVMEVVRWPGERPRVRLRTVPPVDGFSPELVTDSDPARPGRDGDFGTILVDPHGFRKVLLGVRVSTGGAETPAAAIALGRVVLVSGGGRAAAVDPATGAVREGVPPGTDTAELGGCVYVAHPDGYSVRYGRLERIDVEAGQGVLPGTAIGAGGVEGVHLEVRWGNPLSDKDSVPLNPWEFFEGRAGEDEWR
ncbi:MAG: M23 family metallopeptidase [bacterium]|nr:M23 family metallopeptidase [bacterium]